MDYTATTAKREIQKIVEAFLRDPRLMDQAADEDDHNDTCRTLWAIAQAGKKRCGIRRNKSILDYIIDDVRLDLTRETNFKEPEHE